MISVMSCIRTFLTNPFKLCHEIIVKGYHDELVFITIWFKKPVHVCSLSRTLPIIKPCDEKDKRWQNNLEWTVGNI